MKKVLIANRGEIAVRVIRACLDANLSSVAVYSDPDADALHVRLADEAYALHGSTGAETYLDIAKLLDVAKRSGADAVHPGYGFLSENADFAQAVLDAGLTWIGPGPDAIRTLGNKVSARELAQRVGAPLAPGSDGPVSTAAEVRAFAEEHGLPIIIKAAFGGGGRGMKVIHRLEDVQDAFDSATREAVVAFGRGECFVERFLDRPRHVEAQVVADAHGNVVVVGTRDCSLQRRNQKLVEEAPAPFLSEEQRASIHEASRRICSEVGYVGAGTVEFMVAADGLVSFLEVNTRLQVEHPVTEATTGVDLVREQFRIAAGEWLSLERDPEPIGHAFEFRINAEDPALGFLPTPGPVTGFQAPFGHAVRLDTGVLAGDAVPPQYDSLMAKLIITGENREQALKRARLALDEFRIEGLPTVLPFHRAVVRDEDFTSEPYRVDTGWIERDFTARLEASDQVALAPDGSRAEFTIDVDGRAVRLGLPAALTSLLGVAAQAGAGLGGEAAPSGTGQGAPAPDDASVTAPVDGTLAAWKVRDGAAVEAGDPIAAVEAMKMETVVTAKRSGVVRLAPLAAGEAVRRGQELARVE
ncbi:ATP-grasp domain-containing protein [Galactobacter valiniphilus]|uniref:biotin carboxylase n=1 Tax=Galactobacter valiniphilus TaxID=2676122 RepID=A0A399JIF8_9MICC|nr:biotin carboxylase N-terminal domain-containing protein [Galactobacter valiniphilus]RII42216.1 ATP-grasp domain-containing protein [Galactobacter valiniphilus]